MTSEVVSSTGSSSLEKVGGEYDDNLSCESGCNFYFRPNSDFWDWNSGGECCCERQCCTNWEEGKIVPGCAPGAMGYLAL
jgi:hypothetical protein